METEKGFDGDPLSMLEGLEEKTISNLNETVPAIGGALASLMANYSDSEEDRPSQTDKHTGQSLSHSLLDLDTCTSTR